jgi:TPR repeat protein
MARTQTMLFEMSEINGTASMPDALFELGLMHCAGRDGALDLVNAHKWFNLAAMRGNAEAKRYRMEIAREMSRAEIAEAQRLAREWLARH